MNKPHPITTVFVDIGGVLLTNGWDHHSRQAAAKKFGLNYAEIEDRHKLMFETLENGKLTLSEYLDEVVFNEERPFTHAQFRRFMFGQSRAFPETIELISQLKFRHGLKIAVVSNEGRELNAYRMREFKLAYFVDFFICSSFVGLRKPDLDFFRLALDVSQTPIDQIVYIDNTPMFVEIARDMGIHSILHIDSASTCERLADFGLEFDCRSFAVV